MSAPRALAKDAYTIGWVCALPSEMAAARGMLDEIHQDLEDQDLLDHNNYILGNIHNHNVVVACLPAGVYGIAPAATVARDMLRSFRAIRFGLMVGIGGGAPSPDHDIRLGDVVVSQPSGPYGGVIQYDRGKTIAGQASECIDGNPPQMQPDFRRTGALNSPPTVVLNALNRLQAEHESSFSKISEFIKDMVGRYPKMKEYTPQGVECDFLYKAGYEHPGSDSTCEGCDHSQRVQRSVREDTNPQIFYGNIASGNQVIKHGLTRDRLRKDFDVLCFEMEAAGLLPDFPCLVIRGICDYADSHKNKKWQKYAAATAAAFAKELLMTISSGRVHQEKAILQVSDTVLQQITSSIDNNITQLAQDQSSRYKNDRERSCHQVFKTSTYEQFKNINSEPAPGTCMWAFSHSQYMQWAEAPKDDLLWISADPGCGKSVLAKALIDRELRATDNRSLCYFFFKDNDEQDKLSTALCAILHQLFTARPGLLKHALPTWEKNGDKIRHEVDELWRVYLSAATDTDAGDVICVFDALDECRPQDRQILIRKLSSFHTSLPVMRSNGKLKFLVTSRPYDDIESGFDAITSSIPAIRLSGELENDKIHAEIDNVIRQRVATLARENKLNSATARRLEQRLLGMEHRTYLWLHLALASIREIYRNSLSPDLEFFETLPTSVEDAYERLLEKIKPQHRVTANTLLYLIVGARRSWTTAEMAIAFAVQSSPNAKSINDLDWDKDRLADRIRHLCGLFVFINHSKIYLIHQTAKEFLLRVSSKQRALSIWTNFPSPINSERLMVTVCVRYLLLNEVWQLPYTWLSRYLSELDNSPEYAEFSRALAQQDKPNIALWKQRVHCADLTNFLSYAAENWSDHCQSAKIRFEDPLTAKVCQLFRKNGEDSPLWFRIAWRRRYNPASFPEHVRNIHLAAFSGNSAVLQFLIEFMMHDVDEPDPAGCTPLYWAASEGHIDACEFLLNMGADVNLAASQHYLPRTSIMEGDYKDLPLVAASAAGHESVVHFLLEHGADLHRASKNQGSALCEASMSGHRSVVQLLLRKGADVNTIGGEYGTALQAASYSGETEVVRILLENGANVNAEGGYYGTALQAASYSGNTELVRTLLENGANVNVEGGYYGTALQAASCLAHKQVMLILLENGADVNAVGGYYGTALQAVSSVQTYSDEEDVVQILLENEANVNAEGGYYGTALQAASCLANKQVMLILLENGADVNAVGGYYGTALQAASSGQACSDEEDVVQILLENKADVNMEGGKYGTALQAASRAGLNAVVKKLLDCGANVNAHVQRSRHGTALIAALVGKQDEIARLLCDHGANTPRAEEINSPYALELDPFGLLSSDVD